MTPLALIPANQIQSRARVRLNTVRMLNAEAAASAQEVELEQLGPIALLNQARKTLGLDENSGILLRGVNASHSRVPQTR